MKNQNNFDFKDLLTFGIFLLALLTFVFVFIIYHKRRESSRIKSLWGGVRKAA